jgi:hypothetical protein
MTCRRAPLALVAAALSVAVSACEDQGFTSAALGPSRAEVVTAVIRTPAGPILPSRCSPFGVFTSDLTIVVTSPRTSASLEQVTLHLLDGTNVGGEAVTFPQPTLTARFGDTLVRAGTSRAFAFAPTFRCGRLTPRSLRGELGFIRADGGRFSLKTAVPVDDDDD